MLIRISETQVINIQQATGLYIGKEIIEKKEKYGLYCIMATDQEKVAIAYYETKKKAMEELKMMLNCWKHKQDIYFIRQEKAVL